MLRRSHMQGQMTCCVIMRLELNDGSMMIGIELLAHMVERRSPADHHPLGVDIYAYAVSTHSTHVYIQVEKSFL